MLLPAISFQHYADAMLCAINTAHAMRALSRACRVAGIRAQRCRACYACVPPAHTVMMRDAYVCEQRESDGERERKEAECSRKESEYDMKEYDI